MRKLLSGFALTLSLSVQADPFGPTRELIRDRMIEENVPSIAVAVARDGKIVWEEGFGWANRAKRIVATPDTAYSLASVSKPLTATGLMILTQRGLIDLDRPMNDYLGRNKIVARVGDARDATVRRVANHTSGLPQHWQYFYADEPIPRPSMEETIARSAQLVTAPGEAFVYSNLGYGLIEYAIERSSGKAFADFMREEVFLPLGMTHSFISVGAKSRERAAIRYARNGAEISFYDVDTRGAGGAFASAHDVLLFAMFSLKNHLPSQQPILKDATIDSMAPAQGDPDTYRYGIGWESRPRAAYNGLRAVAHRGDMAGVSTRLTMFPDQGIAIVVLSNCENKINRPIEESIVNALLPQTLRYGRSFKPQEALVGRWQGAVSIGEARTPVVLDIKSDGQVIGQVGDAVPTEIKQVKWSEGVLALNDVVGTLKAARMARPYRLSFSLRPHGNSLDGAVTAEERPVPGRGGNGVSYWAALERVPSQSLK